MKSEVGGVGVGGGHIEGLLNIFRTWELLEENLEGAGLWHDRGPGLILFILKRVRG